MSGPTAPGWPAPRGFLGNLRSWLRIWAMERWGSSDDLPMDATGPRPRAHDAVRVLVVDDNPVNLMLVSALMESRGLTPWLAGDGAEAVALACEMHFDLILMDLQMPILDGWQATAAIRRFEHDRSRPAVPIVAHSGTPVGDGVLASHGLNGSLAKPCGHQDLEDCLVRWCPTYHPWPTVEGAPREHATWPTAPHGPGSTGASPR